MTITKIKQGLAWALLVTALGLVGCGGGGSSSKSKTDTPPPPVAGGGGGGNDDGGGGGGDNDDGGGNGDDDKNDPQTGTGVFVDGPVAGVSYSTSPGNHTGVTNAKGEYQFTEGDKVTFRIGGIVFPEVTAKGTVTPLDMGGEGADLNSPVVINILRLLQTLDDDGDPENGISISADTVEQLTENGVEIADFADEDNFNDVVADNIKDAIGRDLVEDVKATEHFENSVNNLLAGSWLYVEEDGAQNLLTFLPNLGLYLLAHDTENDDQGAGTVEFGTYELDVSKGEITVELIDHTDGSGGFISGNTRVMGLSINGNTLSFVIGDEGPVDFTAVRDIDNALVGAWMFYEPEDDNLNILTIFPGNKYVVVHSNNQEAQDGVVLAQSSEWGTYTAQAGGVVQFNKPRVETDGEGGLYDEDASSKFKLTPQPNGDLEFYEQDEDDPESFAFRSLDPFIFTLRANDSELQVVLTRRESPFVNDDMVYGVEGVPAVFRFNADGTGSLEVGDSTQTITEWELNSAGTLLFTVVDEDEQESSWRISPVRGKYDLTVLIEATTGEETVSQLAGFTEPL